MENVTAFTELQERVDSLSVSVGENRWKWCKNESKLQLLKYRLAIARDTEK